MWIKSNIYWLSRILYRVFSRKCPSFFQPYSPCRLQSRVGWEMSILLVWSTTSFNVYGVKWDLKMDPFYYAQYTRFPFHWDDTHPVMLTFTESPFRLVNKWSVIIFSNLFISCSALADDTALTWSKAGKPGRAGRQAGSNRHLFRERVQLCLRWEKKGEGERDREAEAPGRETEHSTSTGAAAPGGFVTNTAVEGGEGALAYSVSA